MPTHNPQLEKYASLLCATERNARGGFVAVCPAHPDTAPSLSVNPGDEVDVVFHCFAGCTRGEILAALNELRNCPTPGDDPSRLPLKARPKRIGNCTVAALAEAKRLPVEFLESLGLNANQGTVVIPYRLEDGTRAFRHRRRWAVRAENGGSTWTGERGSGGIVPYGLHRLAGEGRPYCFLVEGESDCWTFWYAGLPALGIPGATMVHVLEAAHVAQFEWLIVWREPGSGGDAFVRGLTERLPGANLRVVCGADLGAKDASELWCADPDVRHFRATLLKAVRL